MAYYWPQERRVYGRVRIGKKKSEKAPCAYRSSAGHRYTLGKSSKKYRGERCHSYGQSDRRGNYYSKEARCAYDSDVVTAYERVIGAQRAPEAPPPYHVPLQGTHVRQSLPVYASPTECLYEGNVSDTGPAQQPKRYARTRTPSRKKTRIPSHRRPRPPWYARGS